MRRSAFRRRLLLGIAAVAGIVGVFAAYAALRPVTPDVPVDDAPPRANGTPMRCEGVRLSRSDDLQDSFDSHPEGTTFCLSPGTYRIDTALVPKANQELIAVRLRSAILSGARVASAARQGNHWVITGQRSLGRSEFNYSAQCRPVEDVDPEEMCVYKDQVFIDDRSLWQVGSLDRLSSGEFYWDYEQNKIFLADNPSGHTLEVSVTGTVAIDGVNPDVRIRGLVIEKFGNPVQGGAVDAGDGWVISDSEIRLNHGGGVHMSPGTVLRRNFIHHNGQIGIHGGQASCAAAKGMVVADNEIAYNNSAGYNWGFEGGATKWTHTDGLTVLNNYVHDNYGMGLWTDGSNINTVFQGNVVEENHGMGINHELGYSAVIRDNVVRRNGFYHPEQGAAWGAGIFIDQSRDVEVYGNVVENNAAGITAIQEPAGDQCGYGIAEVANLDVHDNTITQEEGIAAGLQLLATDDTSYYETRNNRWESNTYVLDDADSGTYFYWSGRPMTATEWRAQGNDRESSF